MNKLKETALLFLKLGIIAFGGPAAHIAMMEDEVVTKRKWMSRQHFLDLVGATNLIPGPNSTEMAIHCGYQRAGLAGLIVAGVSFILPAVLITIVIAYFYVKYGSLPDVQPFLSGIKPAVIAIILNAIYKLGSKALKTYKLVLIGILVIIINFMGVSEVVSILIGGTAGMILIYYTGEGKSFLGLFFPLLFAYNIFLQIADKINDKADISLSKLFLIFLKIGAVLFGSGYVLVAYFDGELVQGLNWLTRQELLDAIAIGQFTPGPVLSSATFVGYQIAGIYGAVIATAGIFLPSFIFVLILNPVIPKLRKSKPASAFLDAVNISAVAIMAAITFRLGQDILIDWQAWLIGIISCMVIFYFRKVNSAFIVAGGALLGYLLYLIS